MAELLKTTITQNTNDKYGLKISANPEAPNTLEYTIDKNGEDVWIYNYEDNTGLFDYSIISGSNIKIFAGSGYSGFYNAQPLPAPFKLIIPKYIYDLSTKNIYTVNKIRSDGFVKKTNNEYEENTFLASIEIPNSIIEIEGGAFRNCTALKEVIFAKKSNLERLTGGGTFHNCKSLEDIVLPDTLISIGYNYNASAPTDDKYISESEVGYFENCKSLEKIVLPSSLTKLHQKCFKNCINLRELTIPENVTNIGREAFRGCYSLNNIYNYSDLNISFSERSDERNGSLGTYAREIFNLKTPYTFKDTATLIDFVPLFPYGRKPTDMGTIPDGTILVIRGNKNDAPNDISFGTGVDEIHLGGQLIPLKYNASKDKWYGFNKFHSSYPTDPSELAISTFQYNAGEEKWTLTGYTTDVNLGITIIDIIKAMPFDSTLSIQIGTRWDAYGEYNESNIFYKNLIPEYNDDDMNRRSFRNHKEK